MYIYINQRIYYQQFRYPLSTPSPRAYCYATIQPLAICVCNLPCRNPPLVKWHANVPIMWKACDLWTDLTIPGKQWWCSQNRCYQMMVCGVQYVIQDFAWWLAELAMLKLRSFYISILTTSREGVCLVCFWYTSLINVSI